MFAKVSMVPAISFGGLLEFCVDDVKFNQSAADWDDKTHVWFRLSQFPT